MALSQAITVLVFVLTVTQIDLSICQVLVNGKVTCLDCNSKSDLSGIKVLVECDKMKKLAMAIAEADGSFEIEPPSDYMPSPTPLSRVSKHVGGPNQLYASKKFMTSQIVKTHDSNTYTISNPLSFYTSCPSTIGHAKGETMKSKWGSSINVDLPVPPEWGLAHSSYFVPFFPIIGIP